MYTKHFETGQKIQIVYLNQDPAHQNLYEGNLTMQFKLLISASALLLGSLPFDSDASLVINTSWGRLEWFESTGFIQCLPQCWRGYFYFGYWHHYDACTWLSAYSSSASCLDLVVRFSCVGYGSVWQETQQISFFDIVRRLRHGSKQGTHHVLIFKPLL